KTMFGWLAQHTVSVFVLAVVIGLLCQWGRLGPAAKHALWLLVLLKFCEPPGLVWPWKVPFYTAWETTETATDNLFAERKTDCGTELSIRDSKVLSKPNVISNDPFFSELDSQKTATSSPSEQLPLFNRDTSAVPRTNTWWQSVPWLALGGWLWATSSFVVF